MHRSAASCVVASVAAALAAACSDDSPPPAEAEILVRVEKVAVDHRDTPVVLLQESDGRRVLPIWIGPAEATSIASELEKRRAVRPNSHDLARSLIHRLDATVDRVVVTSLRGGTYYGVLHLKVNGRSIEIDVRPSDGIAVALRAEAPILVRDSVFTRAGDALKSEPTGRPINWDRHDGRQPATRRLNL